MIMGLDDFINESSTEGADSEQDTEGIEKFKKEPVQAFNPNGTTTSEDIRSTILETEINWTKQFSLRRTRAGEVVYVTDEVDTEDSQLGIIVFTTIQSATRTLYDLKELNIIVVPWDLKESKPVGEHAEVEFYENGLGTYDNWKEELQDYIHDLSYDFLDYVVICEYCNSPMVASRYLMNGNVEFKCRDLGHRKKEI